VNSEKRLTLSRQLGDVIYDYSNVQPRQTRQCLQLAQHVYLSTASHAQAMVCMVRLSNVETALEYADQQQCDALQLVQVPACDMRLLILVRYSEGPLSLKSTVAVNSKSNPNSNPNPDPTLTLP